MMSESWLKLTNQVCVVTGATGGMGEKICFEFAKQGAVVVLIDIKAAALATLKQKLETETGATVYVENCDVTDPAAVEAASQSIVAEAGHIDVLVNTAGILKFAPLEDLKYETWQQVLKVNLDGYFLTAQTFGKVMKAQGHGSMVHISTVASLAPETYSGAYSTSKAGVNMLSKQIAAEWGQYGVRSNVLMPCLVKTPMSMPFYADPEVENGRKKLTANKRIGTVQDIADGVLFLASDRASYVNGAALPVDGGFNMMMGDQIPKPGGRKQYAIDHETDW